MHLPPNELYSAFSFIGFVLCVIPFYWHFKARNTGTCLFMIWTGLGCLLQCINSIVWNKNMINRAPVYCDISTHIQVALNVAIPACALCINRLLYRVARMKSAGTADAENCRVVVIDLLLGVGIPVLQMIVQYVVSTNRYAILEDFGPTFSNGFLLPAFFLFRVWPLAIGIVSLYYSAVNIYTFYMHESQCRQMMSSASGFSRSRYLRLIAISSADIFGTIPIATFFIVFDAKKKAVNPWKSWADTHRHYSVVPQIAGVTWKNVPELALELEMFRWSLVACAFIFFALFGFAAEAREQYHRLYKSLARCIGYSMSTPHGAPHAAPSVPYVKRNGLGSVTVTVPIMVPTGRHHDSLSLTDQSSMPSISMMSTLNPDSATEKASHSDTISSYHSAKSFAELEMQGQSSPPAGNLLTDPASVPPHFSDTSESTMPVHASSSIDIV